MLKNQANARNGVTYYRLVVPPGPTHLFFGMTHGTGDADMYVRRGAPPTGTLYDYRPFKVGNTESVQVLYPEPGEWYLMVHARAAYAGLSVWGVHWADPALTTVATPAIVPAGGAFKTPVAVTMSCATPGAAIHYTLDNTDPTPSSPAYAPFTLHTDATVRARAFRPGLTSSLVATVSYQIDTNAPPTPGLPPMGRLIDLERFSWTPLNAEGTRGILTVPLRWPIQFVNLSGNYSADFLGKLAPRADGAYNVVIPPRTKLIVQLPGFPKPDRALPRQCIVVEYSFDPRVAQNLWSARVLHYSYKGVWSRFRDWSWLTRGSAAPNWNAFELLRR